MIGTRYQRFLKEEAMLVRLLDGTAYAAWQDYFISRLGEKFTDHELASILYGLSEAP